MLRKNCFDIRSIVPLANKTCIYNGIMDGCLGTVYLFIGTALFL